MEKIRTLGLHQPFASLMIHGKIETRLVTLGRKPPFPIGKYLLYATKKEYFWEESSGVMGRYAQGAHEILKKEPTRHFRGYALCVGDLVRIIDAECDPINEIHSEKTFVDLPSLVRDVHGYPAWRRVGLVFENMKRINPFPFKGKQGIGFLSDEDYKQIKYV
jgi:hypothetical protein